jgi:SAM-dependent methyltransferase
MHKLHMEHPLAVGVRARKDFMVEMIEREHEKIIEEQGTKAELRVVSLGCGPARETSDFVARNKNWPGRVIWTLIDQEEKALSVAYRTSQREITKNRSNCSLSLLNLSFMQMLSEGLPLRQPGSQNFIFSTGLFDYVRESRAHSLLQGMYDLLAPGGMLAIGNAMAPNEHFWAPEFMGDWTMLYRTEEEMLRLASKLPEGAEIEVVKEPAGAYYFLLVKRH